MTESRPLGKVKIDQPQVGPKGKMSGSERVNRSASGTMQVNFQDFRRRIQIGAGIRFANGARKKIPHSSCEHVRVRLFYPPLS